MKKSIFLGIFGLAISVASSRGQGYVLMNSYACNNGLGAITTYLGVPVPGYWTAELYYALGTVYDPPSYGLPSGAFTALPSSLVNFDANNDGYFQLSTPVIVPNYVSGAITFEIVTSDPGFTLSSGSFTESSIQTNPSAPPSLFGDNGPGIPPSVVIIPEPTTLALAGLGGLVSLVMFRRRPRTAVQ